MITKSLQKTSTKTDNKAKYDKLITSIAEHIDNTELKEGFVNKWREY